MDIAPRDRRSGMGILPPPRAGNLRARNPGRPPILLEAGDVAVLPHGDAHAVRGTTTEADVFETANLRQRHSGAILVKSNQDGAAETELVCGRLNSSRPTKI